MKNKHKPVDETESDLVRITSMENKYFGGSIGGCPDQKKGFIVPPLSPVELVTIFPERCYLISQMLKAGLNVEVDALTAISYTRKSNEVMSVNDFWPIKIMGFRNGEENYLEEAVSYFPGSSIGWSLSGAEYYPKKEIKIETNIRYSTGKNERGEISHIDTSFDQAKELGIINVETMPKDFKDEYRKLVENLFGNSVNGKVTVASNEDFRKNRLIERLTL